MAVIKSIFDDYYGVSRKGNVYRLKPDSLGRTTNVGKRLKPFKDKAGYLHVGIEYRGKRRSFGVHQIVAMAFIGPCPLGHQVNHKDLDKSNNRLSNLEYLTPLQNSLHAIRNGHDTKGENNPRCKLSWKKVINIRKLWCFWVRNTAEEFNVSDVAIKNIILGKNWKKEK